MINALFLQIGATSLTDVEFDSLTIETAAADLATYNALLAVLDSRETVSNARDRLRYYFLARGVEIAVSTGGTTKIFVGSVL